MLHEPSTAEQWQRDSLHGWNMKWLSLLQLVISGPDNVPLDILVDLIFNFVVCVCVCVLLLLFLKFLYIQIFHKAAVFLTHPCCVKKACDVLCLLITVQTWLLPL